MVTETDLRTRVYEALELAMDYGAIDGDHHKMWVIDQMVRTLTGCPFEKVTAIDCRGVEYTYDVLGKNEEYIELIRQYTYEWDEGIAP
jgi:hypothetical protein